MFNSNHNIIAELKPTKSGIFTLGSLFISATLMGFGAWMISQDQYLSGFLLFVPGAIAGITSYIHGFAFGKNQDLDSGHPIKIATDKDRYELSADPRTDKEFLLNLISATADIFNNRKPLPEADGIVNNDGSVDSSVEKKVEANSYVKKINSECENEVRALENAMGSNQIIDPAIVSKVPQSELSDK